MTDWAKKDRDIRVAQSCNLAVEIVTPLVKSEELFPVDTLRLAMDIQPDVLKWLKDCMETEQELFEKGETIDELDPIFKNIKTIKEHIDTFKSYDVLHKWMKDNGKYITVYLNNLKSEETREKNKKDLTVYTKNKLQSLKDTL